MAPNQITFKAGQMKHYVAARTFALGNTGTNVSKGSDIMFDGTRAEVDGSEYTMPMLRGAVKAGWLVLAEDFDENDDTAERPVSANVQVRHATQGGNPMQPNRAPTHSMSTTESDEREVQGSISQQAARTKQRNASYKRGQAVNVVQPGTTVMTKHGFEVVEDQDGVEVGRTLKTAAGEKAKTKRTVLTAGTVGQALAEAGKVQIDPGAGLSEEEMLEQMTEEQRELYLAEKAQLRAQYVDDDPAPRKVGKVKSGNRTQTTEGIKATVSTGGGIETADPSFGGKAKESTITEDGITFRTTNGPEKLAPEPHPRADVPPVVLKDGSSETDTRLMIAKMMCPDFPSNYMFNMPDRKKIARLAADYDDRPDVIRAVYAAEGDAFKAKLVEEFPQVFGK